MVTPMRRYIGPSYVGKRVLMTGNEAVARGAIEAGVRVAAAYPGTPSTEILENIAKVAAQLGIHAEWSTNEKVAFEVAAGAAMAGVKAMASMKYAGVNWAADALITVSLTGVEGGCVLVSADDPQAHSSACEQDNRFYGAFAEIPMLEPANPQEAKDAVITAFDLSERLKVPVLFRSVTRLAHSHGFVTLGRIPEESQKANFIRNVDRWCTSTSRVHQTQRHRDLHRKVAEAKKNVERLPYNRLEVERHQNVGVAASGFTYNYAKEAARMLGVEDEVAFLKVGTPFPIPESMVKRLLSTVNKLLVVEEVEPYLENQIRILATKIKADVEIEGRSTDILPDTGELTPDIVASALSKLVEVKYKPITLERGELLKAASDFTPKRPVNLCSGCPHRGAYYSLKRVLRGYRDAVVTGDIGCYGMGGRRPPFEVTDTHHCMGASIGLACGLKQSGLEGPVLAAIGDSTLIHAGIPPMINAVYNEAEITILVFDNRIVAMTGFQTHPGTGITAVGDKTKRLEIDKVAEAIGVKQTYVVDPYDVSETEKTLKDAIESGETAVVVFRRLCALEAERILRRSGVEIRRFTVDPEKCTGCKLCITQFGCPAIGFEEEKAVIDEVLCDGCGVCVQICSQEALIGEATPLPRDYK